MLNSIKLKAGLAIMGGVFDVTIIVNKENQYFIGCDFIANIVLLTIHQH